MKSTFQTLGFGVLVLFATVGSYAMASGYLAIMVIGVLYWGWSRRMQIAGQGSATAVFAFGMGMLGISSSIQAAAKQPDLELQVARDLMIIGLIPMPFAIAAGMLACGLLARAKGRSRWWSLLGTVNLIGFVVMLALPTRVAIAGSAADEPNEGVG